MNESPKRPSQDPAGASVSSSERDRTVEALTRHYAEDRLSESDLEARLDRVYAAGTSAELEAVLVDLPDLEAKAVVPAARGGATLASPAPRRVRAFLSGHEQAITGVVPPRLRIRARLGYVELDLSRATFEPGVTEINVRALMGYVQVILPAGARVESDGRGLFGYFAVRGGSGADAANGPVVRITGRALFGYAECFVRSGESAGAGQLPPAPEG